MQDLSQRTVLFLIQNDQVLLGYKKSGFGKGNYLGIGGKVETGESNEMAAVREVKEEVNLEVLNLQKVGDMTFLFPEKPSWSQQVHVYLSKKWLGEPQETDEIRPKWFGTTSLPLDAMWDDNQFWLPAILHGHSLKGAFTFNADLKVVTLKLSEHRF